MFRKQPAHRNAINSEDTNRDDKLFRISSLPFRRSNWARPNARHHPPRIQPRNHPSLADESRAIRGRVHAVVRWRPPMKCAFLPPNATSPKEQLACHPQIPTPMQSSNIRLENPPGNFSPQHQQGDSLPQISRNYNIHQWESNSMRCQYSPPQIELFPYAATRPCLWHSTHEALWHLPHHDHSRVHAKVFVKLCAGQIS